MPLNLLAESHAGSSRIEAVQPHDDLTPYARWGPIRSIRAAPYRPEPTCAARNAIRERTTGFPVTPSTLTSRSRRARPSPTAVRHIRVYP